ncbi:Cobalt ion binding protein [Zostera marina]|uniref:Cobalt ion binding protein n=1 Tax=Zostera marina TaxID=29655 RepID=A0A0K9P860_ZOSMR|nr:Cobalt ion binding protein [Zostera marina]
MSTTTAVQFWIPHQALKRRRSPVTQVLTRDFFLSFKDGRGCRSSASSSSNYVVPMGKAESSVATRPLVEILRDLNKRVSDNVVNAEDNSVFWYHANRLLSFYASGWCGEIRKVVFSTDTESVTVVYRITVRGTDGEAHREATGTASSKDVEDPVIIAEQRAFCSACARFGLGLYLYHNDHVKSGK